MTEPYRIRSPETWAQARDDYLAGLDAESVCRRHDLGLSAFRRRARKYGWRRVDQDDPAPRDPDRDLDLSIYDDVTAEEQIRMARQRFTRALDHGRPMEAARWRRLWRELCAETQALDADLFPGMGRAEVAALLAADARDDALGARPGRASRRPGRPGARQCARCARRFFECRFSARRDRPFVPTRTAAILTPQPCRGSLCPRLRERPEASTALTVKSL
jgi:hypothetical protein